MNLGSGEILVILLVALLVLGPTRLPEAARQVGKAMRTIRSVSTGFQDEMRHAMEDTVEADAARDAGVAYTPASKPGVRRDDAPDATTTPSRDDVPDPGGPTDLTAADDDTGQNGTGENGTGPSKPTRPTISGPAARGTTEPGGPTISGPAARGTTAAGDETGENGTGPAEPTRTTISGPAARGTTEPGGATISGPEALAGGRRTADAESPAGDDVRVSDDDEPTGRSAPA